MLYTFFKLNILLLLLDFIIFHEFYFLGPWSSSPSVPSAQWKQQRPWKRVTVNHRPGIRGLWFGLQRRAISGTDFSRQWWNWQWSTQKTTLGRVCMSLGMLGEREQQEQMLLSNRCLLAGVQPQTATTSEARASGRHLGRTIMETRTIRWISATAAYRL